MRRSPSQYSDGENASWEEVHATANHDLNELATVRIPEALLIAGLNPASRCYVNTY